MPKGEMTKYVTTVTVIDPDTKGEVEVEIRKCMESGAMVGLDGSWLEQLDNHPNNPYNPGKIIVPDDEVIEREGQTT